MTSKLIANLENEAQLASVLGHEISHAIQEHQYRQSRYHKWSLMALQIGAAFAASRGQYSARDAAKLIEAAVRNGYARNLENQADHFGVRYIVQAGYDPREAPRVWKLFTFQEGDHAPDFFWSNHDTNTLRRSYLMAELKNNYSDVDYATLRKGETEFAPIAPKVRASQTVRKRIKIR